MLSSRLSRRIFWALFLTLMVIAVSLSSTLLPQYREVIENQLTTELENISKALALSAEQILLEAPEARDSQVFRQLTLTHAFQIHLFDANGQLVASSLGDPIPERVVLNTNYLALSRTRPTIRTVTGTNQESRQEVFLRQIQQGPQKLGYLQVEASRSDLENQLKQLNRATWGTTLAIVLLGLLLSILIAKRLADPLERLLQASEAVNEGHLFPTLPITSEDELGSLAETFNRINQQLSSRIQLLQQKENKLQQNNEQLQTVLSGMVEGVIAVDSQDRILLANEAAMRMIDFMGRNVIGRLYWEVLRNTDVQKVVRDVLSGQNPQRQEINHPRSQNRIAFIVSRLPGTPCPGVVLVLHDVTELRKLEKIRSEFVSNVGHELKTPLAAIQACTETLSGGAIEDPVHAEHFLKQIMDHADRLHKLIIDLMELAKIESEEDAFQLQEIDIGIPIQEAIDEHYSVSRSKRIELTFDSTIDELPVLADPDGMRTIINNLLDNALNYTPEGGRVHVSWRAVQQEVVIEIQDTGMGIDRKHLDRIFERFYRVDSARSRDAGGTGLGLAIVKHLCQLFSGNIEVTSELGHGSTFQIRFPLLTQPELSQQQH